MNIFVTGGSGFIGSHLVEKLVEQGHYVTITASQTERPTKAHKTLYLGFTGISNWNLPEFDVVFNLAADNDTQTKDIERMKDANFHGPLSLFYKLSCKKFIYASTTAVYGNAPAPYIEDQTTTIPLTAYGKSKFLFENLISQHEHIPIIGLRFCNVYGPGEEHKGKRASMVFQMAKCIKNKISPRLFKSGEQKRDWVYVDDVVNACIKAMDYNKTSIFNIGSGTATTFNKLVGYLTDQEMLNTNTYWGFPKVEYIDHPFPETYQNHTECNIEKARNLLGYEPEISIKIGIKKLLETI